MCEALTFLFDNIYIRFAIQVYGHIVSIPLSINCAHLVGYLFLFCFETDFMMSLSGIRTLKLSKPSSHRLYMTCKLLIIPNGGSRGVS